MQNAPPKQIMEVIDSFHLGWLQAVDEIECFNKRVNTTSRDLILKTIDFTLDCVRKRHANLQSYVEQQKAALSRSQQRLMQAEIETMGDMRELVHYALLDKQRCLSNQADRRDFSVIINGEIEELLNWLDQLNDHLAIELLKIVHLKVPITPCDLVKTLEDIIDEVASCPSPQAIEAAEKFAAKGQRLAIGALRECNPRGLDVVRIVEKIKYLEDRLERLKQEESSAVMAIEHKTLYLEERLQSLENLKLSLNCLKIQRSARNGKDPETHANMRIFNHCLPQTERCRFVERLITLWKTGIYGDNKRKSIISILSATDMKEVFSDDNGQFSVDKYGRKIYTIEGDDQLYQLNDQNQLVPVDDQMHIYYYDECGRYYLSEQRERVYKRNSCASEYLLHRRGVMLKVAEFEDNIEYGYDRLGRHYINKKGERIYKEKRSPHEYIHDGLGNLVLIGDEMPNHTYCPREPAVLEETMYLKHEVGDALKKCIADVVLTQPTDPIKHLADSLDRYRLCIIAKQKRMSELEEFMAARAYERERALALQPPPSSMSTDYQQEASTIDLNFIQFHTPMP